MPTSPPLASAPESSSRRRRALVAGGVAALSYVALSLVVRFVPPLQPFLSWVWLVLSGPGYLVLSLFQPLPMTPLQLAFLLISGAALCFAVAATATYSRRFRLAIIFLWAVFALCTSAISLVFTIFASVEPLP